MSERWIDVAASDEVELDWPVGVDAEGQAICLYRLADGIFATAAKCTHGDANLADGLIVDGARIECPLHEGTFDIRSGQATGAPCTVPLRCFRVRVVGSRVEVGVGD